MSAACRRSSIEVCESKMSHERVRPCHIILDGEDGQKCHGRRIEVVPIVVRPICCYADCRQLLSILAVVALLYAIVSLVLTCIFAPHPYFIAALSYTIVTMIVILVGIFAGKNFIMKLAFGLTVVLVILACVGVVYCIVYLIHVFADSSVWKWRVYLITMLVAQVLMIFYVIAILCLIAEIVAFNRRILAEERRARRIPTQWPRY